LKVPSQARKKAARPRTMAEEGKARGAATRSGNSGRRAMRRGSPGRRSDDDGHAYSAAAVTARSNCFLWECKRRRGESREPRHAEKSVHSPKQVHPAARCQIKD
jgi:hypothetical protein